MKARVPKEWDNLSPGQQKRLKDYLAQVATEVALKQEEQDCRIILDLYMKMVCCVLHDAFGFGEERLTMFLGNHRRLFSKQARLVAKDEQTKYLNQRMAEIFKKNGFPREFMDDLLGSVSLVDPSSKED